MTAPAVRLIVIVVCVGGVAAMIVTTVLHHNGAALTFGVITAIAVLCLMVATAVSVGQPVGGPPPASSEVQARQVETAVTAIVAQGVEERTVRDLVREAVKLGRTLEAGPPPPP